MKVVLLAGGLGTRISEESHLKPKPMIEIGDYPILWHIMKIYSHYGFNDFIVCLGYKGYIIKEYFSQYYLHTSDITFDFTDRGYMTVHNNISDPWKVTLVDTGLETMTGGRLRHVQKYIGDEPFMLTYGDGVSNIDLNKLIEFHKAHRGLVTLTSVQPAGKFGAVDIDANGRIDNFKEKPRGDGGWINGGFFVCEPQVFNYLENDSTVWEREPLEKIALEGNLFAYKHNGFWQCMDTQRDKMNLEEMWGSGKAPWRIWK